MGSIKTWAWVHKWSSLVCTIFMLLLCLTGLPLIFGHEIGHLLGDEVEPPTMAADTPLASMDAVIASAKARYPNDVVQYVFKEPDESTFWFVSMGKTPLDENNKYLMIDSRTAKVLDEPKFDEGFMHIMLRLHVDLFAGLPGMLFLGLMGFLMVIAVVSGAVLYAPFMRRIAFGEIRKNRTEKLKRLDTHNFLGVVTLVWVFVVGLTGVVNAWSELVVNYWQADQMAEMVAPYKDLPPPKRFASIQAGIDVAKKLEPDLNLAFIAFPGTAFSSQHHYGIFMNGNSPLTARLYKPVLIDAQTAELTDSREIPWYMTAFLVSQPLHFGDYGGMTLKIIWAILDILTIVVLWTGLVLWWRKRNQYVPDIETRVSLSEAY
ncbi:MAG: PepSY-associated TM helix domain-containing protein [Methylophilaceae bacterium]